MNNKKLFLAIALILALSGCDANVNKISPEQVEEMKDKITYFKDHKGICWGALQSAKWGGNNSGIMGGVVDCKIVGLAE